MKIFFCFLGAIVFFTCVPVAPAEEYGVFRALQQRAAQVTKQKNDFVTKVLASHNIPHERNSQGVVVRIRVDGKWLDVAAIDIVPVLAEAPGKKQQTEAHRLLFHTSDGTLELLSDLTIR